MMKEPLVTSIRQQESELVSEQKKALSKQHGGTHYKDKAIQPVEYAAANELDFFQGSVVKYVTRHKEKNGAEDIRKAIHMLEFILELQYKEE